MNTITIGPSIHPLGNRPRTLPPGARYPTLDRIIPLLPENLWTDINYSHLLWNLRDQNGRGSCNACAALLALEGCREFQGLERTPLSEGNLYGQINDQVDEGSQLCDALQALRNTGTVPAAIIPNPNWQQTTWPPGWRDVAAGYRLTEVYDCPTFAHIITALHYAFFVDLGIPVYDNFQPDGEGFIPPPRGRLRGYHAMCGCGHRFARGTHHAAAVNSWNRWGLNGSGLCFIPQDYFATQLMDAWCVRVARHPLTAN